MDLFVWQFITSKWHGATVIPSALTGVQKIIIIIMWNWQQQNVILPLFCFSLPAYHVRIWGNCHTLVAALLASSAQPTFQSWTVKATLPYRVPSAIALDKLWRSYGAANTRATFELRRWYLSEPFRQSGQNPLGVVAKSNRMVKEPQVATLGMPVTFVSTKMICCPWGLVLYFLSHFLYFYKWTKRNK